MPRTMPISGYSDRINHALAFAAKHHDRQVRGGSRLPYLAPSPNIGIILTRYGQDEETVLAGILQNTIDDYIREGISSDALAQRIGDKFGPTVLDIGTRASSRRYTPDGVELSLDERRSDYIERMGDADTRALWVAAASLLFSGSSLLAELKRTSFPENVWARLPAGREGTVTWHRQVYDRLVEVGFSAPIMSELEAMVHRLEQVAASATTSGEQPANPN